MSSGTSTALRSSARKRSTAPRSLETSDTSRAERTRINERRNTMANTPQPPLNVTSQMRTLKDQELLKKARSIDPTLRKFIARKALRSQIVRKQKSYYSTIRFPFTVTAVAGQPGQFDFSLSKKKVVAFSYGV